MSKAEKRNTKTIIIELILLMVGIILCGATLNTKPDNAFSAIPVVFGAGLAVCSFIALIASLSGFHNNDNSISKEKKEKHKSILLSTIFFVIGAVVSVSIVQLGANDFFSAILVFVGGITMFISFWVLMASIFE